MLVNWGRWAGRSGGGGANVSPGFRDAVRGARWASSTPLPTASPIDVPGALAVEHTVCATGFSPLIRQLLVLHYVRGAPQALICQVLHLVPRTFDERLQRAAGYFWARHEPESAKVGSDC